MYTTTQIALFAFIGSLGIDHTNVLSLHVDRNHITVVSRGADADAPLETQRIELWKEGE